MEFLEIADIFNKLESTSARLEMTSILTEFFKPLDPSDLRKIIYLSGGKLHPDFINKELGMADKLVLKAISKTTGHGTEEINKLLLKEGDPGVIAETLIKNRKQRSLFSFGEEEKKGSLSLDKVFDTLVKIENSDGKDSQNDKMKLFSGLLDDANPVEARYLSRIVTGRMRVGASTMTVLDALSQAFATKEERPEIERAFNITCDLGEIGEILARDGMAGIRKIKVKVGNPIKVMLAERLPSIQEVVDKMGGSCALEYKYDGMRAQIHISENYAKIYSRRLEDLTHNFPDVIESLKKHFKGKEAIIEGECVAVDADGIMQPFQNVTHRRRKHGMEEAVKEYPVRIFLFDILYLDGKDLTLEPYKTRRETIKSAFDISDNIQMSTMRIVNSVDEAEQFFDEAINARCEGMMAKSLSDESIYRAGSRGFLWIKYKKDYHSNLTDSFDLVVVGAFYGMGKRAGKYGALLMAVFNQETGKFETACKLGTGFDDAFLDNLPNLLDKYKKESKPSIVDAKMIPDVWFDPSVVLEIVGAEISVSPIHTAAMNEVKEDSGIGIRFPRFTGRVRNDKDAEQATTSGELLEMYYLQAHDSDGLQR